MNYDELHWTARTSTTSKIFYSSSYLTWPTSAEQICSKIRMSIGCCPMQRRPAGIVSHIQLSSRTAQKRLVAAACETETANWTWPLSLKSLKNCWRLMPHLPKPIFMDSSGDFFTFFRVAAMVWSPIRAAICKGLVPSSPAALAGTPRLLSTSAECVPQFGGVFFRWHLECGSHVDTFRWKTFAYRFSPSYSFVRSRCMPPVLSKRYCIILYPVIAMLHWLLRIGSWPVSTAFMIDIHRIPRSTVKQPFANEHHLCWTGASQAVQSDRIHKASNLQAT